MENTNSHLHQDSARLTFQLINKPNNSLGREVESLNDRADLAEAETLLWGVPSPR